MFYFGCVYANCILVGKIPCMVFWSAVCVIGFVVVLWYIFNALSRTVIIRDLVQHRDSRDIELKKYELIYQEITRYRDASWKISGLAWAIYSGIIFLTINKDHLYFKFGPQEFYATILLTAVIATIFLIWSEHALLNNMRLRLSLERNLGLHEDFSFREERLKITHWASLGSITLFLLSIWIPVLIVLRLK